MIQSPATDFIIRIKNAYMSGKKQLITPSSKFIVSLADIIFKNGYISDYQIKEDQGKKSLILNLKYQKEVPAISGVKLFSTPGRRLYINSQNIPWGSTPKALIIISTSLGLLTQRQAQKAKIGGELLAQIW